MKMEGKIDRLFVARDCCPDCADVRVALNAEAVMDDEFRGKDDQRLHVFSALSDEAARELLDSFGHTDKFVPLLVRYDGTMIEKPGKVVVYLQDQGMTGD